ALSQASAAAVAQAKRDGRGTGGGLADVDGVQKRSPHPPRHPAAGRHRQRAVHALPRGLQCRREHDLFRRRQGIVPAGADHPAEMRPARPHAPEDDSIMVTSAKRGKQPRRAAGRSERSKSTKSARATANPTRSGGPAPRPPVTDAHAHVLVPEVMKRTYEDSQYARAVAGPGGVPEPLFQRMTELPLRLREMDATDVDIQVISPSIMQQ